LHGRRVQEKKDVFIEAAKKYNLPVFMVNQVGANTDLIFEGGSLVVNPKGEIYDRISRFEEDFQIYDLEEVLNTPAHGTDPAVSGRQKMIFNALVLGIRDFFLKTALNRLSLVCREA
jgi:NAD+ synthase (glutamine-hydrolysing)